VNRFVDRGAIVAAWVGVGMAVTIGVSFLLVIPIEPIYWLLALPAGLMIGYYANARSRREGGPWARLLANGLLAGVMTGVTLALLLLVIKALFFFADSGYRNAGGPLTCTPGADCVYQRYLAAGQGPALEAAGVTDVRSFTDLYWREQAGTATLLLVLSSTGALAGAGLYGITNRRGVVQPGTSGV
jgi:hypothetical protein